MRTVGRVPVIMGEFGNDDPPNYVRGLLSDLEKNYISWAAWSLIGWEPQEGLIDCQSRRLLPLGELVKSNLASRAAPLFDKQRLPSGSYLKLR